MQEFSGLDIGPVAQLVEHPSGKWEVVGSYPTRPCAGPWIFWIDYQWKSCPFKYLLGNTHNVAWLILQPTNPLHLWNQYDTVLTRLPCSNNLVEVWHNGFQTLVGCSNPTLRTFLTALNKEENLTFSKKVKMSLGYGPEPKRRKWRLYDERPGSRLSSMTPTSTIPWTTCTVSDRCCLRAK